MQPGDEILAVSTTQPQATQHGTRGADAAVRIWLWLVAALVFAMIVVGGATRLTDSGLSITEWQPIHGTIPPLNAAEWQEEFEKYQEIPEYRLVKQGMTLEEFKGIFWWEWGHRFLGRFIGVPGRRPYRNEYGKRGAVSTGPLRPPGAARLRGGARPAGAWG